VVIVVDAAFPARSILAHETAAGPRLRRVKAWSTTVPATTGPTGPERPTARSEPTGATHAAPQLSEPMPNGQVAPPRSDHWAPPPAVVEVPKVPVTDCE
jgi:hypothetical protein